jgi:hypothetical protein
LKITFCNCAGTFAGNGGGESFKIAEDTSKAVSPVNGRRPEAIS